MKITIDLNLSLSQMNQKFGTSNCSKIVKLLSDYKFLSDLYVRDFDFFLKIYKIKYSLSDETINSLKLIMFEENNFANLEDKHIFNLMKLFNNLGQKYQNDFANFLILLLKQNEKSPDFINGAIMLLNNYPFLDQVIEYVSTNLASVENEELSKLILKNIYIYRLDYLMYLYMKQKHKY